MMCAPLVGVRRLLLSGGSVFHRRDVVGHEEFLTAVFTRVLPDLYGIELGLARDRDIFSAVWTSDHEALSYAAILKRQKLRDKD
jgi:hypothetical protein